MNPFETYFYNNPGRLVDKWTHYFEIYHRHFQRFRGQDITLLEIGIYHGGSLQMWKEYFGSQVKIVGVDINPRCKSLEEDRVQIRIGSQDDPAFLAELKAEFPSIHVVIDDGSHEPIPTKIAFESLYPHLHENGTYLVEDLHTNYMAHFKGKYRAPDTFVEFSKGLIDSLMAYHFETDEATVDEITRTTHGIHFYDSIAVFEKRRVAPPKRVASGELSFPAPENAAVYEASGNLIRPYADPASWRSRFSRAWSILRNG